MIYGCGAGSLSGLKFVYISPKKALYLAAVQNDNSIEHQACKKSITLSLFW
jgi:hypothetical protein